MKGSLTSASAVLKGFAGWVTRRRSEARADVETPETQEVVWACGQRIPLEGSELDTRREFATQQDRWPLGPGVDNFS
jgi:hypothetical protein